jgi:hypothetical protein
VIVRVDARHRVQCQRVISLPLTRRQVWGQLRDFHRYACHDMFHVRLTPDGNGYRQGTKFRLTHRFLGVTLERHGRILQWQEEQGYSFSDLSARGARYGFPHTFRYVIREVADGCELEVTIRGRWTATWVPRVVARVWLWWVFAKLTGSVESDLLMFALALQRRGAKAESGRTIRP